MAQDTAFRIFLTTNDLQKLLAAKREQGKTITY